MPEEKRRGNGRGVFSHRARRRSLLLTFAEFVRDQLQERIHRFFFVGALGLDQHGAADARCKHHHAHDAFRVDAAAVAAHPDFGLEVRGQLRQLGRRACVQAQLVHDCRFLLQHLMIRRAVIKVVGAVVGAAVLTPSTDPLTQMLLAGPLLGLYLGGAWMVKLIGR